MAQIYFANLNDSFIKWNDKSAKLTWKTYTKHTQLGRFCGALRVQYNYYIDVGLLPVVSEAFIVPCHD